MTAVTITVADVHLSEMFISVQVLRFFQVDRWFYGCDEARSFPSLTKDATSFDFPETILKINEPS